MTIYVGPNPNINSTIPVNENLLKLYLDTTLSITNSQWDDLSTSKIVFEPKGGAHTPITQEKGGVNAVVFNGDGYWESTGSGHDSLDLGGECTLVMWIYFENIDERDTIFEKAGTSYNSYEQELAVTWESSESLSYYNRYNAYDIASIASQDLPLNNWHMVALKMSTGKSGTLRTGFYSLNGQPWVANYSARSTNPILPAGVIRIGTGYAGPVEAGAIALVAGYERQLSDGEIQAFYSKTAFKFGV